MSSLNIKQLEAFIKISQLGSFGEAAKHLRISQPAISARMRQLEEELGIVLFHRNVAPVKLSIQGRDLYKHAEQIVGLVSELRQKASSFKRAYGTVRIGSTHSLALTWLPALLDRLRSKYKGLNLELTVDLTTVLTDMLENGQLDVAFIVKPLTQIDASYSTLYERELVWACSLKAQYAPDPVSPYLLADIPIITDAPGSQVYQATLNWFSSAGVTPTKMNTCPGLGRIQLIASGHWIGVVPKDVVDPTWGGLRIRALSAEPVLGSIEYGIALGPTGAKLGIQEFVDQAKEYHRTPNRPRHALSTGGSARGRS